MFDAKQVVSSAPGTAILSDDIERIREALQFIDPVDRDTWVRMGFAIKDELGEAGFETAKSARLNTVSAESRSRVFFLAWYCIDPAHLPHGTPLKYGRAIRGLALPAFALQVADGSKAPTTKLAGSIKRVLSKQRDQPLAGHVAPGRDHNTNFRTACGLPNTHAVQSARYPLGHLVIHKSASHGALTEKAVYFQ
jgi:hypothetical protein